METTLNHPIQLLEIAKEELIEDLKMVYPEKPKSMLIRLSEINEGLKILTLCNV